MLILVGVIAFILIIGMLCDDIEHNPKECKRCQEQFYWYRHGK